MTDRPKTPTHGPKEPAGSLLLLFSGGLDTTLEVVELVKEYEVLHLLTFNNGHCVNMGGARRRAEELSAMVGEGRLVHSTVDTSGLMGRLLERLPSAPRSTRSPLGFDMACKMAAITHVIRYARERGVGVFADGSSVDQTQVFIQHPEFAAHVKPFIERYGISFEPPRRFHWSREEKIRRIEELGLASGPRVLEFMRITSQIAHQPFCMRGFVTFAFTSPARHLPPFRYMGLSMDQAKLLWDHLLPEAERWLHEQGIGEGGEQ